MKAQGSTSGQFRPIVALFWFVLSGLAVFAFHATAQQHADFAFDYVGISTIPPSELAFYAWFGFYGVMATVCFALAWRETRVPDRMAAAIANSAGNPDVWVVIAAGAVVFVAVVIRHAVLLSEPVADDELAYRFIAQTLLQGQLVNEPPVPPGFLANQFVVVAVDGWFGKYPIGHPLVLALGEVARLSGVIIPMLSGGSVALTFAVGRRFFSTRIAVLGCLLLAVSAQFVLTAATELSQPTETFFVLLGTWCLLSLQEDSRWRWVLLGGFAWGMCILVRPLPGALCACVAGMAFIGIIRRSGASERKLRLAQFAVATLIIAVLAACIVVTNAAQSGDAMTSGYHRVHGSALRFRFDAAVWSTSLFGALLRQNYWLFGVPFSLLLVPFARPRQGRFLFWGLIVAICSYRWIAPKTVVSTTGPVYVAELLPFLCLATAAGMVKLGGALQRLAVARAQASVASLALGAGMVSLLMFLPVQLGNIHRGAYARASVLRALEELEATERVVVFCGRLIDIEKMQTWAYYPPSPDPGFSDRILFLRLPPGPEGVGAAVALWQAKLPDRRAFVWSNANKDESLTELFVRAPQDVAGPTK